MYLVSSRKNFTDPYNFSTQLQLGRLSGNGRVLRVSKTLFQRNIKNKKVLVLLLGFNKTYDYVVEGYEELFKKIRTYLPGEYQEIVGYLWPVEQPQKDCFSLHTKRNMRYAGELFRNWISHFFNSENTIDIMGHSTGLGVGYVMLQSILPFHIRHVFSMGPAITANWLLKEKTQQTILNNARKFYLFNTRDDMILKFRFQMVMEEKSFGYSRLPGPGQFLKKYNKISIIDCSEVILDHLDYLKTPTVFYLMADLLQGNKSKRVIKLKEYVNDIGLPKAPNKFHRQAAFEFNSNI